MPLDFQNGLAYLKLRPFKLKESDELPHIHMTRDIRWVPTRYDASPSTENDWFARQDDPKSIRPNFDLQGDYTKRTIAAKTDMSPAYYIVKKSCAVLSQLNEATLAGPYHANDVSDDYKGMRKYFLNMPESTVKRTFQATTRNLLESRYPGGKR